MKNNLNRYIAAEYENLKSELEQREFVEKIRFLMMAKDKDFTDYYSSRTLTKEEFYSVADTLYALNNLWMLSGFIRQNRQVLFQEVRSSMNGLKSPDFTETCRFGKETMLSRMFQVMERFQLNNCMVAEDGGSGYTVAARRMKHTHLQQGMGKMCRRLSCRGTGWSSGALRLAAACLWSVTRISWLS